MIKCNDSPTFKELLDTSEIKLLLDTFAKRFNVSNIEKYERAIEEMRLLKTKTLNEKNAIKIEASIFEGSDWLVDGINLEEKKEFALDLVLWNELLNYKVITPLNKIDTLCEIIYEITYYGSSMSELKARIQTMKKTDEADTIEVNIKYKEVMLNGGIILPEPMTETEASNLVIMALEKAGLSFCGIINTKECEIHEIVPKEAKGDCCGFRK